MTTDDTSGTLPPGVNVRLILVRHGEPDEWARGKCYGKLDVSLSARGSEQARRAALWLARWPLAAVYTSPRRRAKESAEVIAAMHALDVRVEEGFCEIDFGEFEGLAYDEVAARYPQEYQAWMERPTEVTFPGGESFATMRERVERTAAQVRRAHSGESVALVTHGGVARIILAGALRMNASDIFRLAQSYAGVSVVDYYGETPVVRLVNHTGELLL
jgi:alpha-ribazole phosphatase